MQLLNIAEPNIVKKDQNKRIAIGIDLGTTNSLIASVDKDNKPFIIGDIMPSVVQYDDNVISSIKRLLGKSKSDIKSIAGSLPFDLADDLSNTDDIRIIISDKYITPVEISAQILINLKEQAEDFIQDTIEYAVITVPAYFDDAARLAVKQAAKLAGIEVLRLINEPTAAALSYGLDNEAEGVYLIYDLGGGTFDISILRMQMGVFQVLATGGDANLGGDDFDSLIVEDFCNKYNIKPDSKQLRYLLEKAKSIKESSEEEKLFIFENYSYLYTKYDIEKIIEPLIDKTILIAKDLLDEIENEKIKSLILVGGSTKLSLIKNKLRKIFDFPILTNIDPEKIVALGAALQANNLIGNSNNLLIDVTPLSLGIEIMGGLVDKIIPKNTVLPVIVEKEFTTFQDNQTGMQIHVVQGEREMVNDCRSLAKFELKGLHPARAGKTKVRISFTLDVDNLLTISAMDLSTNSKQEINIKPSYGLKNEEIEKMILESYQYAKQDIENRKLTETQLDALTFINALSNIINEDISYIEKSLYNLLLDKIAEMRDLCNNLSIMNIDDMKIKIKSLEEISDHIIKEHTQRYLNKTILDKNIKEIEGLFDESKNV